MNYKNRDLFKLLEEAPSASIDIEVDAGNYDLKCVFSVHKGELQARTYAVIRQYEQEIEVSQEVVDTMFLRACDAFDGDGE